jgi:hypothetical protein
MKEITVKELIAILKEMSPDGNKPVRIYVEEQGDNFEIEKIENQEDRIIIY